MTGISASIPELMQWVNINTHWQKNWLIKELPKTKEGGFQHVTSGIGDRNAVIFNESELWIDTIFMSGLFLYNMEITGFFRQ